MPYNQIMPAIYEKLGIRFLYPENWELSDDEPSAAQQSVTVQSPGGGFWSLNVLPWLTEPDGALRESLDAMRAEYDTLEARQAGEEIAGIPAAGYDMDFYCLDMVVSARSRCLTHSGRVLLILYQAESRDFETLLPVFRAITESLLGRAAD